MTCSPTTRLRQKDFTASCSVGNSKALAEAIIKLAEDPSLRDKLGREGHKFLEGFPTWEQLAEDIYNIYID